MVFCLGFGAGTRRFGLLPGPRPPAVVSRAPQGHAVRDLLGALLAHVATRARSTRVPLGPRLRPGWLIVAVRELAELAARPSLSVFPGPSISSYCAVAGKRNKLIVHATLALYRDDALSWHPAV